jgi:hypothetical protein
MEENRVDLDSSVKDHYGLPAPRITHRQHANDIAMNRWLTARLLDLAKPFVALSPEQQDEALAALESGKAQGWPRGSVTAGEFFTAVRAHTLIGFLADPKYGGNRDYAGWKVAGYPGGGHHLGGYSPAQLIGKEKIKTAWGEEV